MEWAAATIDNMEWTTEAGRSLWGKEALQEMIRVAWVPAEQHLSYRTWEAQGGPRPRWGKLFHVLSFTAMPGWIRDEAWNVLSGNVWWGFDRLKWAPSTANCGYCVGEGVTAISIQSRDGEPFCMLPTMEAAVASSLENTAGGRASGPRARMVCSIRA